MKALTKGQYEGIASVISGRVDNIRHLDKLGYSDSQKLVMYYTITDLVDFLAHLFQESDPEFKRELFLSQCGITK